MFGIFGVGTSSLGYFLARLKKKKTKKTTTGSILIFRLHVGEFTLHYTGHQHSNDDKVVFSSQVNRTRIRTKFVK